MPWWNRKGRWGRSIELALVMVGMLAFTRYLVLRHTEQVLQRQMTAAAVPAPAPADRVLIFAPHPDDETLGAAGFIQQALAAKARVRVVAMTNGEYPEIDVILFEETLSPTPKKFIRLGYMRQDELKRAMTVLGLPADDVTFLGYPNGYLFRMWLPGHWLPSHPVTSARTHTSSSPFTNAMTPGAVYCGASMLKDVETLLEREQPTTIITLHPNDVNVDHWPTYTVVRYALEELKSRGIPFAQRARLLTYLIHRDHWPVPRALRPILPLTPPKPLAQLDATQWLTLPLTTDETKKKHLTITTYRTQGGSMDPLLLAFARTNELFGEIPALTWPTTATVPPTTVTIDPPADLKSAGGDAAGDILGVSLARNANLLTATLTLCGAPRPSETYHLAFHAGGPTEADRAIAAYDISKEHPTGRVVQDGALRVLDPASLYAKYDKPAHTVTVTVPWPFREHATFFMVRAWTTLGKRTIDQTATATLDIR